MYKYIETAAEALKQEAYGIINIAELLLCNEEKATLFDKAIEKMLQVEGRIIICGMGKSGIVGRKIAATLASVGTPSMYLHPSEAYHGDLGMITKKDLVLAISYSGETEEVIRVVPFLENNGIPLVSLTGNPESTLAKHSDVHIDVHVTEEACPLNLAPTTSTTVALAMGDAIAVTLMRAKEFKPENFAEFHPGGSLGRKLLNKVSDLMEKNNLPICKKGTFLPDAISEMTRSKLGIAILVDDDNYPLGVFTDGDLRRIIENDAANINTTSLMKAVKAPPLTIHHSATMLEAEDKMKENRVKCLLAVNDNGILVGVVHIFEG